MYNHFVITFITTFMLSLCSLLVFMSIHTFICIPLIVSHALKIIVQINKNISRSSNKNGVYTAKSGYTWLLSHTNTVTNVQPSATWSWIWKLKLPEKLKFIFWLACHNSFPTLFLLNNMNMASSALCSRYGLVDETFLHCVRDAISKSIWHHVDFHDENFILDMDVPLVKGGFLRSSFFHFCGHCLVGMASSKSHVSQQRDLDSQSPLLQHPQYGRFFQSLFQK